MVFYEIFELLCKERGISPTRAARENGLKQQSVSSWKTRGSTPKAETVQKLADYFGVPMAYLLGVEDNPQRDRSLREAAELLPNAVIVPFEGDETAKPGLYIDLAASGYLDTKGRLDLAFNALNEDGQQKAVERVEELTEIPRYRRQGPQGSPMSGTPGTEPPEDGGKGGSGNWGTAP